jgi:hypothetical protein
VKPTGRMPWNVFALAHATNEPVTRAVLTDMATAWIKLGEQAEKNGQTDLVYEPHLCTVSGYGRRAGLTERHP